jgi:hypothetical protein
MSSWSALGCQTRHLLQRISPSPRLLPRLPVSLSLLQGGIGPAGLASEDLHVLDFTDMDRPRWHRSDQAQPPCCSAAAVMHQCGTTGTREFCATVEGLLGTCQS